MEQSFEEKLLQVELLEVKRLWASKKSFVFLRKRLRRAVIYDEVAEIDLSSKEVAQLCRVFPCKVNLKKGNLLYAVEKKYKNKLATYKPSKRLKWMRVNLKSILKNPEEKHLRWQQRHDANKRLNWLIRKLHALDYFWDQMANIQTEESCSSISAQSRCLRRMTNESCSTAGNTSSASVQTVIASQPRNTQESCDGDRYREDASLIFDFKDVSRSVESSSSGELPSICVEGAVVPYGSEAQPLQASSIPALIENAQRKVAMPLLPESEFGISSQEDNYVTFYQDMQVTSTQEFG